MIYKKKKRRAWPIRTVFLNFWRHRRIDIVRALSLTLSLVFIHSFHFVFALCLCFLCLCTPRCWRYSVVFVVLLFLLLQLYNCYNWRAQSIFKWDAFYSSETTCIWRNQKQKNSLANTNNALKTHTHSHIILD